VENIPVQRTEKIDTRGKRENAHILLPDELPGGDGVEVIFYSVNVLAILLHVRSPIFILPAIELAIDFCKSFSPVSSSC
jgi:hypothetical protein